MRTHIFSDKEIEVIEKYLNENILWNGYTLLRHRMKKYAPDIRRDFALMEAFLEKMEKGHR